MNRQEFIDQFTEWMNHMADKVFLAQTPEEAPSLFPVEEEKKADTIKPYNPRGRCQRVSHVAKHYKVKTVRIHAIIDDLGIKEFDDANYASITQEDTLLLVKVIEKKYNNFNNL